MLKVGVYGGSFDPVHKDHIEICERFASQLSLDEVLVIPTKISPFKSNSGASGVQRLDMLKIACSGNKKLIPSDIELNLEGKSYTYRTIEILRERFADAKLYYLMGADSLKTFPNWYQPEKIVANCEIVVAGRKGENITEAIANFESKFNKSPIVIQANGGISSSYVRELLKVGADCSNLLPKGVFEYITSNNLYNGEGYYDYLKRNLTPSRLYHVAGVAYLSEYYAKKIGESVDNAHIAGLLHDIAKYKRASDYPDFSFIEGFNEREYPQIAHQFLGAHVAKKELGITNNDILQAISWHTTGRKNMSNLEKIVFVADLLEPSRNYEEVDFLREQCERDFESGFRLCVKRLIAYLDRSGQAIHPYTIEANDFYNQNNNNK